LHAGEEFAKKGDQTDAGLKELKEQLGAGAGAPSTGAEKAEGAESTA
jgi:hypothetical protein